MNGTNYPRSAIPKGRCGRACAATQAVLLMLCGCGTTGKLVVETPDLINPVCLSSRVALVETTAARRVGNVDSEAKEDWFSFLIGLFHSEVREKTNNIQSELLNVTRGHRDQAVRNVQVTVENTTMWFFPLLMFGKVTTAHLTGELMLWEEPK